MILRDLRLIGDYDVVVKSKDLKIPDMTSQYDYFGLSMPVFNLTINLSNTPLSLGQASYSESKESDTDRRYQNQRRWRINDKV